MQHEQELHAALLRHNRQVPRYTSYPTAPHFSDAVSGDTVNGWLEGLAPAANLSLYFHLPFCRKLCWYCGCNTRATRKYAPVKQYLAYLLREIDLVAKRLTGGQIVKHIHFGGGSPSMLSPDDFSALARQIREKFTVSPKAEIAIELDPREVTEAKVAAYARSGVNRASLGVQDFHADVQHAINRVQPFHVIYDTVQHLRAYGIDQINMDLLYGLPKQGVTHLTKNVDFATALGPSRISLFGYAHVPWMKKHMRLIDEATLPDGAARLQQFDAARERLQQRGYVPIGLDHFVHPNDPMAIAADRGDLKRNFQGYTTDDAEALIGFGTSAISAFPWGYAQNASVNHQYFEAIDRNKPATLRGIETDADDQMRRALIETLMCNFELDLKAFCKAYDVDAGYFNPELERLKALEKDGLVEVSETIVKVPDDARQAARLVAAAFDRYLTPTKGRHAQVA